MALAGALGSTARLGSLRVAGYRLAPRLPCAVAPNARSFSVLLQRSTRHSINRSQLLLLTARRNASTEAPAVSNGPAATPLDESVASGAATIPPDVVHVDAATVDTSGASEVLTGLADSVTTHLPAALQYGDLAALGLISWTPAGLIRWSIELINVTTGLPWFWTIVGASLFWKAVLIPISIKSLRNSSRLLPLQPHIVKLQAEMEAVRKTGDKLAMQRTALKIRKLYSDAGVSMGATALVPFIQIPVTLGMFFGIKKLCDLPLPQLMNSGLDILPNLTVADPYMILPIALCAAVNVQISIGAAELNLTERPEMGHIMNGLRLLSVAGIWVMSAFPSGLMVSLLTTSVATTLQSYLLQQPRIRTALDIPIVPREARGQLPSPRESVDYVIAKWKSKVNEAKSQAAAGQRRR